MVLFISPGNDNILEGSQEEIALREEYGLKLLDEYMEELEDPECFEIRAKCVKCKQARLQLFVFLYANANRVRPALHHMATKLHQIPPYLMKARRKHSGFTVVGLFVQMFLSWEI